MTRLGVWWSLLRTRLGVWWFLQRTPDLAWLEQAEAYYRHWCEGEVWLLRGEAEVCWEV